MQNGVGKIALVVSSVVFAAAAHAVPIKWTLNSVTFDDDGAASGSFVYEADTNTFSQIQVTTSAGRAGTAESFSKVCTSSTDCFFESSAGAAGFMSGATSGDLTNSKVFYLAFQSALTDAGGEIDVAPGQGGTLTCTAPTCFSNAQQPANVRALAAGSVKGVPYVAPASPASVPTLNQWSLMLLASLLGGLTFWRQRRVK